MHNTRIHIVEAELQWGADDWVPVEDLARACRVELDWIMGHIDDEVLPARRREGRYYLQCSAIWRLQQMHRIERQFDADPHLAALVTDLLEELRSLRRQLRLREPGQ